MSQMEDLLTRAQQAGAVRADIEVDDVKALMVGCQLMQRTSAGPATAARTLAVVRDGLTPRPTPEIGSRV